MINDPLRSESCVAEYPGNPVSEQGIQQEDYSKNRKLLTQRSAACFEDQEHANDTPEVVTEVGYTAS